MVLISGVAIAQDVRFGVRFAADVSAVVALQLRADLEAPGDGFGVRAVIGSWALISGAEVMGYYRFASDGRGSSGYVGAGGGVLVVLNVLLGLVGGPVFVTPFYLAGLIGYEYALGDHFRLFAEFRPAWLFVDGGTLSFVPLLGLGLNIYF